MNSDLTVADFRARWNEVLDQLERANRVAWMAFFDGRLESFDNGRLTLDFSDPADPEPIIQYAITRSQWEASQ